MSTDYSVVLTADGSQYTFYPQSCTFTRPLCSRALRHEEQSVSVVLPYSPTLLVLFVENEQLPAVIKDGVTVVFTGVISVELNWDDAGALEEIESFNAQVKDNTYLLDASSTDEIALPNTTVGAVITSLCTVRGVTIASESVLPSAALEIFQADSGSNYKTLLDDLCYQYGYVYLFNDNGHLMLFDFSTIPDNPSLLDDSFLSIKVSIQKSKRDYTGVKIGYNTITKKDNELIYFSGNGYKSDSTVQPYIIQPNVYFPFDSDPALEETNGQIYQSYESGYAQTLVKLNGEQKYQRSSGTTLLHTENQYLVNDWDGGTLSVNRTEFGSKKASVRLLNTGTTDVKLYSLSIRATAWYRETDASVSAGRTDNPFEFSAKYIYAAASAEILAKLLTRYLCIGQYQLQTQTEEKIPLGTFRTIATGATGYTVKALAISYNHDPEKGYYTTTWISVSDAKVNVTKAVYQGSSTGDAAAQTTPSKSLDNGSLTVSAAASVDGITIKTTISDNLQTAVRSIQLQLRKSSADAWSSSIDSALGSYFYTFVRSTDGYPESAAITAYQVRVRYINIYGATSDWTNGVSVSADAYGTWQLQTPSVTASITGRSIILSLSQPARSDNKPVYGTVRNKIYIRKPSTDPAGTWYKPATSSDPYASVNNYKDGSGYITADQQYSQTMPLDGQNAAEPLPVGTAYQYKLVAYNEAGESTAATITVTALATSARDIVASAITANKIATGAVTQTALADNAVIASKINNGAITEAKVAAAAISNSKLADSAVTAAKIAANTITAAEIAAGAVTTDELASNAVTAEKIAAGSVETDKLAANAVTADKIHASTITGDKIATTDLAANGAVLGSISGNKVGTTSSNFWSGLDTNTPEFRIGNDPALENNGNDNAVFFHFKWVAGVATLTMKLVNFILTSVASIIKGVFRVKAAAATDANSFMTVNPESSADSTTGTPAQTVNVKGDVRALSYYTNGKLLPRYYTVDLSSLSTGSFYPVTFGASDNLLDCEIHSPCLGGAAAYNQNIIHFQMFAYGWSDTPKRFDVLQYGVYDGNEITIGSIGYGNTNGERCVWLRGGMLYRFYCNVVPTLHTANYSYGSSNTEIYTVGTNYYGGTNTNITIVWTPDTSLQSYHYGMKKVDSMTVGNSMTAANAVFSGTMKVPVLSATPSGATVGMDWLNIGI